MERGLIDGDDFRKILCPVDFNDNSMAALGQEAKLAQKDDALLYLLHVEFVPMSNPAELADYITLSSEPGKLRLEPLARQTPGQGETPASRPIRMARGGAIA